MDYPCLSIAGFDGSGGAGIQADLKTFSALGCYGMTVLTALPVQNTCGVRSCYEIPIACIAEQLASIFDDITPRAIKIGMLFSSEIIALVADFLDERAKGIPVVLDPVMVAKSGDRLLQEQAIQTLKSQLLPKVSLITPNLPEAYALIPNCEDKATLLQKLLDLGCQAVLLKGGHEHGEDATDILYTNAQQHGFSLPRIVSNNTHGTGCTLSAAIASFLAKGYGLEASCQQAKEYLHGAMLAAQNFRLGHGHGPVHHFYAFWDR